MIAEKQGVKAIDDTHQFKRDEMRKFVVETMKTDQIDKVNLEELKKAIDGDNMITRLKYRRQVGNTMNGRRAVVAKGEILKQEHMLAKNLDAAKLN